MAVAEEKMLLWWFPAQMAEDATIGGRMCTVRA